MNDEKTVLTDANAIIARHFANDPANAVRAQQCVTEVLTAHPSQQEDDERDAARYRLLRRGQHWSVIDGIGNTLRAETLDTAIDAMSAAQGDAAQGGGK